MTETSGLTYDERKQEDMKKIKETFAELGKEDIEIKSFYRLGRFDAEKHSQGKVRPVKVVLNSKEDRDILMCRKSNLRQSGDEGVRQLHIAYDLTEEERRQLRLKIDEANAKNREDQDFFHRVQGPPWALWIKKERRRPVLNRSSNL